MTFTLFTGNTLLVVAWAEGRADAGDIWKALALAYLTNLVGSVAVAALAFAAGAHAAGDGVRERGVQQAAGRDVDRDRDRVAGVRPLRDGDQRLVEDGVGERGELP